MISGTPFRFAEPGTEGATIGAALLGTGRRLVSVDEAFDLKAQCEEGSALCLVAEDGVVVVALEVFGDELELFVKLAVASRFGAFARQENSIRAIARELGAKTIAFEARRSGWVRALGPHWRPRGTREFVRSV